jgi:UDP-glucose 4-epimerase
MVLNKIGLTGATGMLGRHVQEALERSGAQVIAVNRASASGSEAVGWDLEDWKSLTELDELFSDVQAVVHAGAMVQTNGLVDEGRMFNTNVRACVNLGQWAICRRVPIVHISSSTVYADTTSNKLREDAPTGWRGLGGVYGFSKLLAEDVFKLLGQQGLKLAVVRPSSLYGIGLPATKMVSCFLATAREGRSIELESPVHDRVNFIHAADLAIAILAILKSEVWNIFNIASGNAVSIQELAEACVSVTGRGSILIKEGNSQERDPISRFDLNTDMAKTLLGWKPQFDIKQGLSMMLQGYLHVDDGGSQQF